MRIPRALPFIFLASVSAIGWVSPTARAAQMDKAHLRKRPFKVYAGHLTDDQKRCLAFALKQWVMYDQAPVADGRANRNETARDVTAAGPDHNMGDANDHARSSRSLSADEQHDMKERYGDTSPFHAPNQPVADPTQPNSPWFTEDEGEADLSIEPVDEVPGESSSVLGKADYGTERGQDPETTRLLDYKGKLTDSAAIIWMRNQPKGKQWCYPSDTDGDGWITNKDAKCPRGTRDYYQIIKHELGHYFSFTHRDANFDDVESPPPVYDFPTSFCSTAMTQGNEIGICEAEGSEFGFHAGRAYFAADRPDGIGGYDLWFVTWNDSLGLWVDPTNLGPEVNTPWDEISPYSGIGDAVLYFASNRPGGLGGYDLYRAQRAAVAAWDSVEALPAGVNSAFDDTGPFETPDRLYFASNRPGGVGGFDLYMAHLSDSTNIEWQAAVDLGPPVNSPTNEIDPEVSFQNADSLAVLYFATDRSDLLGMGGYDICRAQMLHGAWDPPVNLGGPVNTPFNETDPSVSLRHMALYLASDRPEGHGGWDLYTAPNLIPRPAVVWDHDATGQPGETVPVGFDVVNTGLTPIDVQPQANNTSGWNLLYNPMPIHLEPAQSLDFPIQVEIPFSAPPGSETEVFLAAQAIGQRAAFSIDHAFASVPEPSGIGSDGTLPGRLALRALPNPILREARLLLDLPYPAHPRIDIFDIGGRRVRRFDTGDLPAGRHAIEWNGTDDSGTSVPAGVYFARVRTDRGEATRTILMLR